MIEYIRRRADGTVCGGPFADGNVYESIADESPLWAEIRNWVDEGHEIEPYSPPPPSDRDVDAERDRRVAASFTFNGVVYQTRPEDRENIAGAATAALAAILVNSAQPGDFRWHGGESDFEWIDADNATHPLDAQSMFAMGQAAMAHKQAHIWAARALKDMESIPLDYTEDQYWPQMPSRQNS
jgi:hypothetical protein